MDFNASDFNATCHAACALDAGCVELCVEESSAEVVVDPLSVVIAVVLLGLSGLFSGLTLGLMSLDVQGLQIIIAGGDPVERRQAERILPVREDGNLLLCTPVLTCTQCAAAVPYVRGTRTSHLHAVRTRGAGQLAPRRHALYVRGTRTSLGRAERTMYHVPWHHRQPSHRAERLAEHHGVGRAVPRRVRRRGECRVRQRPCGCGHLPAAARLPFAACGHCAPRCGRDPCAVDDGAAGGGGGGAHGARARSQVRRWRRSVLLQRTA